MKKIFFSLLAIAAVASCAKTEDVFTDGDSEIKLAPVAKLQTKANHLGAVDGTTYPTEENFDVYAYWKNVPAGQEFTDGSLFLQSLDEGGAEFTNKGNYWGGIDKYYWPKNGSLRFAAYSPAHLTVDHQQADDLYTVAYEQPSLTAETWDFLVAPTSPSYSMMTAAENVAIEFQHALSWITLKVKAKDTDAAKAFDIKKVTINGVNTKANFAAKMGDGIQYEEWMGQNTPAEYVVFEGSQKVTEVLTDIENTVAGTLVIPQATTTVTVEFDQYGVNGTADTPGMTLTLDLVLDKEDAPWEPGKHYNYTLVFGLDEILINPSVVDWEEIIVNDAEIGATNVYSVEQLVAALENGGKIVLQEDLNATSLSVTKDVVLELNGHTIAGSDELTGSYGLINVADGVSLTVNGPGKLTAKATENRGWNAYSSVLSNQKGLLVVNEGVVVEHLGGTDMAYGIDNLTNGKNTKAVTIVNGATVKSPYRAIRQFLNGAEANNELQVKAGSKVIGANKSIWSQDPSAAANSGKLVVEEGAELDGDVYLYVTPGSTEWPVEAYIPASTLVNGSTVISGNVPAGYAVALVNGVYTIVEGVTGAATAEEFAAAITSDVEDISIILTNDVEVAISSLGQQTGGSGEYKLGGENTKNITIDLNGNKLTIATTYWSVLGAKNADAVFTIKNGTMTSSQTSGTWNSYDLCFANCNYVFENVVFEKAIALEAAEKFYNLKNVTINETHDYYAMWVSAKGQNVTIDGLTVNSLGRGIKIDEQYVNAPSHVTMKVANSTFKTAKKAAIVVKSVAGASINLNNVNIAEVAEDSEFAVWVDEDSAAYADRVIVNGGYVRVEGELMTTAVTGAELKTDLNVQGQTVLLIPSENGESLELGGKISIAKGASLIGLGDEPVGIDNDWGSTTFANQAHFTDTHIENIFFDDNMVIDAAIANGNVSFKNCVFGGSVAHQGVHFDSGNGVIVFDNCTFVGRNMFGASLEKVVFNNCTFLNKKSSLTGSDKWTGVNMWGKYEFNNCVFDTEATCNVKCNDVEAAFNGCTYSNGQDIKSVIRNSSSYSAVITFDGAAL